MSKVPSVSYRKIVAALHRDGWVLVRRKGSHLRMQKRTPERTLKIVVPAHSPVKRSTLSHILKQAKIDVEKFLKLL